MANEKAALALSNGVAGEKVGRGNRVTVDSEHQVNTENQIIW